MRFIVLLKNKIFECLLFSFKESEPYFFIYGIAAFIGTFGFYFINQSAIEGDAYESFTIRLIGGILVVPLICNNYWPPIFNKLKIFYWYSVLIYTLPFFFSFMLLMNSSSEIWHINGIICLIILNLFVDWLSFIFLLVVGVSTGMLLYAFKKIGSAPFVSHNLINLILYSYLGPIIYVVLFSRKNRSIHQEKIHTMKMLAGSIAHELRTPLAAMRMGADALRKFLPYYQDAYKKAKEAHLPIHKLTPSEEQGVSTIPDNLRTVSQNAHTMINMLLTNLSENVDNQHLEACSMKACVAEALKEYPLYAHERGLIHWEEESADFIFMGHQGFMKHVLFNLLKNALYAIAAHGEGEIFITLQPATNPKEKNRLIFKDTGPGIPAANLLHIFDRFYTQNEHGSGIGLAFCQSVVQGAGGKITCDSEPGKHTTFTISLPVTSEFVK